MKTKIMIIMIMLCQIVLSGCSTKESLSKDYAIKINNDTVSKAEVYTYFYETYINFESIGGSDIWDTDFDGKTAEDVAKENTLNGIKAVKLSMQQADKLSVSLTDAEKTKSDKDAETFYNGMPEYVRKATGITLDIVKTVMEEKSVYSKVYEKVTEGYIPSEADFESYYNSAKEDYEKYYTVLTVKNIFTNKKEDSESAHSMLIDGEDFDKVFGKYNNNEGNKEVNNEGNNSYDIYKGVLENEFGADFNVTEGEILGPLEVTDGYYIFWVEKIQKTDEVEILKLCRDDYEHTMKQKIFTQEYSSWESAANIEKNDQVWGTITVKGVFN